MSKGQTTTERLIEILYSSLGGDDWTSELLAEICIATGSQSGAVVVADFANRRDTLPAYYGAQGSHAVAYEAMYSPMNPWRRATPVPAVAGDVVLADDVLSLGALRQTQFWRDFLRPMDVDHAAGLVGLSNSRHAISLTLLRSARRGRYGREEESVLRPLAPHWTNACAMRSRLSALNARAQSMESAVDRVATAIVVVDGEGKVLRSNAAASAMFARATFLKLREGRIRAAAPANAQALNTAIASAVAATSASHAAPAAFLAICDEARRHTAIVAVHAMGCSATDADGAAMIFVSEPTELQHPDLADALSSLYRLTKSEIALCHSLLSQGDFQDASQASGLRRSTARSRLQTVYAKTGTQRQAELMLLLGRLRSLGG